MTQQDIADRRGTRAIPSAHLLSALEPAADHTNVSEELTFLQ